MRNFFNKLNIAPRINLFIISILTIIFLILGIYIYITQKKEALYRSNIILQNGLIELKEVINQQLIDKKKYLKASTKIIDEILNNNNNLRLSDSSIALNATNINTNNKYTVQIKSLLFKNKLVYKNQKILKTLDNDFIENITIYQKFEEGYICIASTNNKANLLTQPVGNFIPHNSPVVSVIEGDKIFQKIEHTKQSSYLTIYKALKIKNETVGIISLTTNELEYSELKKVFQQKKYYGNGYPYIISKNGTLLIHPEMEGDDLSGTEFYKKMIKAQNEGKNQIKYIWPENEKGKEKINTFEYHDDLEIFIATSLFEDDLLENTKKLKLIIFFGFLLSFIILIIAVYYFIQPIVRSINKISDIIKEMATGKILDPITHKRQDEVGRIIDSLNILIKNTKETARFANDIEQEKFDSQFTALSDQDVLGNALLDMRKSLKKAQDEDTKRQEEDKKRNWQTQGIARFSEIVRQNSDNIQELGGTIIINLINYLNINQGGLFILKQEENDPDNKYFELVASYAYDRQRFIEKKVLFGEGLIGAAAIEKETIYLTEIPEKYLDITSGLGEATPKCLLIVPLIYEEKILGIIELASFHELKKHEIEFVQKITETIASTIASTQINEQTKILVEELKEKSEQMAAQEEEMRQNMEELQATQEEMSRRSLEQEETIEQLNQENEAKIKELLKKEVEANGVLSALNITTFLIEYDFNGNIIYLNEFAQKILKITKEKLMGKNINELLKYAQNNLKLDDSFWTSLKLGQTQNNILHLKIETRETWLVNYFSPVIDNDGNPLKVLHIAYDITDEKRKEEELKQNVKEVEVIMSSQDRTINKILKKQERKETKLNKKIVELNKLIENLKGEINQLKKNQ